MGNLIYSKKYLASITVLKCDDIIKKSRDFDHYLVPFHSQGLTGSYFVTGVLSASQAI